jgi:hypothetical protein
MREAPTRCAAKPIRCAAAADRLAALDTSPPSVRLSRRKGFVSDASVPRPAAASCRSAASRRRRRGAAAKPGFDIVIRGGTIYDGSGAAPYKGDVGIKGDRIAFVGPGSRERGEANRRSRPCRGARLHQHAELGGGGARPGRPRPIRHPPGRHPRRLRRRLVDGPVDRSRPRRAQAEQTTSATRSPSTASAAISTSSKRGTSVNVASFVGASTVRVHELGRNDVDPTPEQLPACAPVREAMNQGAMGVGSSLIYIPPLTPRPTNSSPSPARRALRRHVHQPHPQRRRRAPDRNRRADRNLPPLRARPRSTT